MVAEGLRDTAILASDAEHFFSADDRGVDVRIFVQLVLVCRIAGGEARQLSYSHKKKGDELGGIFEHHLDSLSIYRMGHLVVVTVRLLANDGVWLCKGGACTSWEVFTSNIHVLDYK